MADGIRHILFRDDTSGQVMLFAEPSELIVANSPADVLACFNRMQAASAAGKWLAGYLSYEAGYVFEKKLASVRGSRPRHAATLLRRL